MHQEGKKKIESIFSDEVKENLSITVENEAEDAFFKVREANKAELEQRILLILAIFLISLIILYFIMKQRRSQEFRIWEYIVCLVFQRGIFMRCLQGKYFVEQ